MLACFRNLLLAVAVVARPTKSLNLISQTLPERGARLEGATGSIIEAASEPREGLPSSPPIAPDITVTAQHDESHHILVAWTARAASTFVMEIWFRFLGCLDEAVAYHPGNLHRYGYEVLKDNKNGGSATREDVLSTGNFKFKIVMNPYHRAVAMYEHAMGNFDKCLPQSNGNFSFVEFLQYIQHDNEQNGFYNESTGNSHCYRHHYKPQVTLQTNDASLYNLICRVEDDMDLCFSTIYSRTGLNFSSGADASAQHNHVHKPLDGDVPNMPWTLFPSDEGRGQTPPSTAFYVGESGRQAASLVQTLYRYDFEAYGYDMFDLEFSCGLS